MSKPKALAAAAAATIVALQTPSAAPRQAQTEPAFPWQVGRCYRVFPTGSDQIYIFKVVEPPAGGWARVEADPRAALVPGGRLPQPAPLWLNTGSVFAVQEWRCSE